MNPAAAYDVAPLAAQLRAAPGLDRLCALLGDEGLADMAEAILEEAARFAQGVLAPLNPVMDQNGCRLDGGRVRTAPGHAEAWKAFCEAGWQTLDKSVDHGGQGLPLVVWAAVQELFDRACVAFGMLPCSQGAASKLLEVHADPEMKAEWLPRLASGEWAATIVIASDCVGFTLPGMMELPGSFSGSDSSPMPQRGPLPSRRISLAIFIRAQAAVLRMPWMSTRPSCAARAANLLGAV